MADYTIPLSAAPEATKISVPTPHLTPVDTGLAQGVNAWQPIDPNANRMKAMQMVEAEGQFQDAQRERSQEANDRAVLEAAKNSGEDLYSTEGLDKIIDKYGTRLSEKSMQGLIKRKQDLENNGFKLRAALRNEDATKVQMAHDTMEQAYKDVSRPLERYDEAIKTHPEDQAKALEEFNAAKAAVITMYKDRKDPATGKPLLSPEKIAEMEKAGLEGWRHSVAESEWKIAQVKRAMQEKKDEAKAHLDEAKSKRELALAEKAQRDEGKTGKLNLQVKTVQIAGEKVVAAFDPHTGDWYLGGKKVDPGSIEPLEKDGTLGNRESVFTQRIIMAGNEASKALTNVVKLPMSSSTGLFGGRRQGPSLFEATKEVFTNKMSSDETRRYNIVATGFQRQLGMIESAGLAPPGSLVHQMDTVMFKEGDTTIDKMSKLAEIRQIVEAGLETTLANPRVPGAERDHINKILGDVRNAVPFTQSDVIDFEQAATKRPKLTLKRYMEEKMAVPPDLGPPAATTIPGGGSTPAPGAAGPAPGASAPATVPGGEKPTKVTSNDDYLKLPSGTLYEDPQGNIRRKK